MPNRPPEPPIEPPMSQSSGEKINRSIQDLSGNIDSQHSSSPEIIPAPRGPAGPDTRNLLASLRHLSNSLVQNTAAMSVAAAKGTGRAAVGAAKMVAKPAAATVETIRKDIDIDKSTFIGGLASTINPIVGGIVDRTIDANRDALKDSAGKMFQAGKSGFSGMFDKFKRSSGDAFEKAKDDLVKDDDKRRSDFGKTHNKSTSITETATNVTRRKVRSDVGGTHKKRSGAVKSFETGSLLLGNPKQPSADTVSAIDRLRLSNITIIAKATEALSGKSISSIGLPHAATGGLVKKSGAAVIHRDEKIIPGKVVDVQTSLLKRIALATESVDTKTSKGSERFGALSIEHSINAQSNSLRDMIKGFKNDNKDDKIIKQNQLDNIATRKSFAQSSLPRKAFRAFISRTDESFAATEGGQMIERLNQLIRLTEKGTLKLGMATRIDKGVSKILVSHPALEGFYNLSKWTTKQLVGITSKTTKSITAVGNFITKGILSSKGKDSEFWAGMNMTTLFKGKYLTDIPKQKTPQAQTAAALFAIYRWQRIYGELTQKQQNELIRLAGGVKQSKEGVQGVIIEKIKRQYKTLQDHSWTGTDKNNAFKRSQLREGARQKKVGENARAKALGLPSTAAEKLEFKNQTILRDLLRAANVQIKIQEKIRQNTGGINSSQGKIIDVQSSWIDESNESQKQRKSLFSWKENEDDKDTIRENKRSAAAKAKQAKKDAGKARWDKAKSRGSKGIAAAGRGMVGMLDFLRSPKGLALIAAILALGTETGRKMAGGAAKWVGKKLWDAIKGEHGGKAQVAAIGGTALAGGYVASKANKVANLGIKTAGAATQATGKTIKVAGNVARQIAIKQGKISKVGKILSSAGTKVDDAGRATRAFGRTGTLKKVWQTGKGIVKGTRRGIPALGNSKLLAGIGTKSKVLKKVGSIARFVPGAAKLGKTAAIKGAGKALIIADVAMQAVGLARSLASKEYAEKTANELGEKGLLKRGLYGALNSGKSIGTAVNIGVQALKAKSNERQREKVTAGTSKGLLEAASERYDGFGADYKKRIKEAKAKTSEDKYSILSKMSKEYREKERESKTVTGRIKGAAGNLTETVSGIAGAVSQAVAEKWKALAGRYGKDVLAPMKVGLSVEEATILLSKTKKSATSKLKEVNWAKGTSRIGGLVSGISIPDFNLKDKEQKLKELNWASGKSYLTDKVRENKIFNETASAIASSKPIKKLGKTMEKSSDTGSENVVTAINNQTILSSSSVQNSGGGGGGGEMKQKLWRPLPFLDGVNI